MNEGTRIELAQVIGKAHIADGMLRLELKAPLLAASANPGQFAMLRTEAPGTILGRPLSISGTDATTGKVIFRFSVVGKGTAWLASRRIGDELSLYGPLGRGFSITGGRCLLVGGGTGIAPLLFLKQRIEEAGGSAVVIAGAKDKMCLMESDALLNSCIITTEDGSAGESGLVTSPMIRLTQVGSFDRCYACGPLPMLREVASIAKKRGLPLQVSLEAQMSCGLGACNGCTCKEVKRGDWWLKVCKDGPVFDAGEVVL